MQVRVRRGSEGCGVAWVRCGVAWVRRGLGTVRRGSDRVRRGSDSSASAFCKPVRQARVRISARQRRPSTEGGAMRTTNDYSTSREVYNNY